jgi:HlyD family secretion protein
LPEVNLEQRPTQFAAERNSGNILILLDRYHPSDDEKALQGPWKVIGQTEDGKPTSVESLQSLTAMFSDIGFGITSRTPGGYPVFDGPCVLDTAKQPKTITMRATGLGNMSPEPHELFGIHKLDGDRLHIAYRWNGPRPEKFESTPGSGVTLLVLERPKTGIVGAQAPGAQVVATSPAPQSANSTGQIGAAAPFAFRTSTVTRGDITATIGASGTVEPEEVVDVGAQVTGTVVSLGADPRGKSDSSYKDKTIDYGSPVEQNMVLAQIDDSLYKTRADQQLAVLARAKAELAAAQSKAKGETSEAAKTAVIVAEAAVAQAQAALKEAEINLAMTTVKSPVRGVIVDRRVNVGQNVGPGPNSAGLFLIAKSLEKMQVWVSVNEADIGRIQKSMEARFTVDAFPKDVFKGTVTQIRLNATLTQNVVIYTVVVDIEKPDRKLLPYMTANLTFQVAKKENVLRVANAALRWRATLDQMAPDVRPSPADWTNRFRAGRHLWAIAVDGKHVRPVDAQIGLTDGTMTEVSGPDVNEGMEVVVGQTLGPEPSVSLPKPIASPFFRPTGTPTSPEPNAPQPKPDALPKAADTPPEVKPPKPPTAVPPSSSHDKPPSASPAVELKVYGGKSFDQWRDLARADLDHATRVKAFQALGSFADSGKSNEALTAIIDALKVDQQPDALKAAYTALRLTGPQGEATIIGAIRGKDPARHLAAIRAMAFGNSSRDTFAIPALIEALDDPDPTVRTYICSALANIAVATEQGSKQDGRASRVHPESEIGPTSKTVIPVLSRLLKDADSRVRNVTVQELDRMGALAKASIPDLIAFIEATVKAEPEMSRRHISSSRELSRVLRVLGHMGPAASAAIPLLKQIKQQPGVTPFEFVRAAEDALFEIQGGKPRPDIEPDSVHPDAAQPGQNPTPQTKGSREPAEK